MHIEFSVTSVFSLFVSILVVPGYRYVLQPQEGSSRKRSFVSTGEEQMADPKVSELHQMLPEMRISAEKFYFEPNH